MAVVACAALIVPQPRAQGVSATVGGNKLFQVIPCHQKAAGDREKSLWNGIEALGQLCRASLSKTGSVSL